MIVTKIRTIIIAGLVADGNVPPMIATTEMNSQLLLLMKAVINIVNPLVITTFVIWNRDEDLMNAAADRWARYCKHKNRIYNYGSSADSRKIQIHNA